VSERPKSGPEFEHDRDLLTTLAWALYEPPAPPVNGLSLRLSADKQQELLLRIWLQQWPELRMEFSFSQSPVSARQFEGALFDLQFSRRPQRAVWSRADRLRTVSGALGGPPPWAERIGEDLERPSGLRDMMWEVGPRLKPRREHVSLVAQLFMISGDSSSPESPAQLVGILAEMAPEPETLSDLKLALLQPALPADEELQLLRALVEHGESAFDLKQLDLQPRVERVLRDAPDALPELVAGIQAAKRGAAVATVVATGIDRTIADEDLRGLSGSEIAALVRACPAIAGRQASWERVEAEQNDVWLAAKAARPRRIERQGIVRALITAGAVVDPDEVTKAWPDVAGAIVEALMTGRVPEPVITKWVGILEPEDLGQLAPKSAEGAQVAATLAQSWEPEALGSLSANWWDSFVALDALVGRVGTRGLVSLFSASLRRKGSSSAAVACWTYSALYELALDRQLDEGFATRLSDDQSEVPEWDIGRRLARSLNRAFKRNDWGVETLLSIKNRPAFGAVLMEDSRSGLARRLVSAATIGKPELRAWQVPMIVDGLQRSSPADLLVAVAELLDTRVRR
jgi:hypothetical protein